MATQIAETAPMATPEVKRKTSRDRALAKLAKAEAAVASTVHVFKPTQAEIDEAITKTAKRLANLRPVLEKVIAKPAPKLAAAIKKAVKATPATTPKPEAAPAATGIVWAHGPTRMKDGSLQGDYRLRLPGGFEDATGTGWATKAEAAKYAADHGLTVKLRKEVGPSGQSIATGAAEKPVKAPKGTTRAAERAAFGIKPFDAVKAAANGVAVA